MNDIKLLALDLDGTLLTREGLVTEKDLASIRAAEEAGVMVTVATGRRFRDARPVAIEVGFNAPILTHNGALVKNAESLEIISSELLCDEVILEVLSIGTSFGGDALVSTDPQGKGTLLYETVSGDNVPLLRYIEWARRLHGAEAEEAVRCVGDLREEISGHEVIHISFSGRCAPMSVLKEQLVEGLGESANILATVYPRLDFTLLDILPSGSSKASGLEKLVRSLGLEPENVMTVGDNFNDLEMLEYAGTAVVMGNADPSLLRREEFYTTLTNDESGVAAAIERHILGVANG